MSSPESLVGRTLGHYRSLEKVGQGGMGVVYRGEDTRLGREVALKLIHPDLLESPDSRRRFLREARAVSALTHPNVRTIHAIEEEEGRLFLVLEFLQGTELKQRAADLRRSGRTLLDIGMMWRHEALRSMAFGLAVGIVVLALVAVGWAIREGRRGAEA